MAKRKSWAARIEAAKKRGGFTEVDKNFATSSWCTCAVGEKHGFPEHVNWQWELPSDGDKSHEYKLGIQFGDAVHDDDIPAAKYLYAEIMALP